MANVRWIIWRSSIMSAILFCLFGSTQTLESQLDRSTPLVSTPWCPPWRHIVVWRHGACFVSRQHSTESDFYSKWPKYEELTCLFIVCETMFTIGESHAISHANVAEQQIQQLAVNPRRGRFDTETESSGARTPTWNSTRATKKETAATNRGTERTSLNEFRMLKYF